MMRAIFFSILLIFHLNGATQSIKPSILNMGGGSGTSNNAQAVWSIGESSIIGNFLSPTMQLNAGVLQPNIDVVTSISNTGSVVFADQITISPNPSYSNIQIRFNMKASGKAILSVYNSASKLVRSFNMNAIAAFQVQTYTLNELAAGSYFLKVHYSALNGTTKEGIFKIIRL